MCSEIILTGKHGNGRVALVDDEDYPDLSVFNWRANLSDWGGTERIHAILCYKGKRFKMSRVIMGLVNNETGLIVDHINGDTLDNRKSNLRICTPAQNSRNRRKPHKEKYTSKYKGVSRYTSAGRWQVTITFRGVTTKIGIFTDEKEAALAYDSYARKLHGEFACLNFPEEHEQGRVAA